jgi:hypothetical protein
MMENTISFDIYRNFAAHLKFCHAEISVVGDQDRHLTISATSQPFDVCPGRNPHGDMAPDFQVF